MMNDIRDFSRDVNIRLHNSSHDVVVRVVDNVASNITLFMNISI